MCNFDLIWLISKLFQWVVCWHTYVNTESVIKTLLLIPIMVCSYSRYVYYNKMSLLFINMWRLVNKDLALQQTLYVADQSKAMLSTFFYLFLYLRIWCWRRVRRSTCSHQIYLLAKQPCLLSVVVLFLIFEATLKYDLALFCHVLQLSMHGLK